MSKTVLITGASSGLGMELAKQYAQRGCDLVLVARRQKKLDQLKGQLAKNKEIDVQLIIADLSESSAAKSIYEKVHANGKQINILINNAGMGIYGLFSENSLEDLTRLNQVNLASLVLLTRLFLEDMLRQKQGHIVNVASVGAFFPGPLMSVYFATKAFILSFTEGLAFELKNTGIRVTTFCPGPFKSDFQEESFGGNRNLVMEDNLPSAQVMAQVLLRGVDKHKDVIIPGLRDKLFYLSSRICSRKQMARFVYSVQKKIMLNH